MGREIDAVVVTTPDHTHGPASIKALEMGKHVHCDKPLAHNVYECRLMANLALRYPGYGWEHNAGYATRDHVAGLHAHGVSPHHRRTFQRIRGILEGDQLAFDLGPEIRGRLDLAPWALEATALGYQFGTLVLPAVAPVALWLGQHRIFVASLAPGMAERFATPRRRD